MSEWLDVEPGTRFGRLVIVSEAQPKNHRRFLCRCDCGRTKTVDITKLRNGHTRSCGCLARESIIERNTTHGMRNQSLYGVWAAMKCRCLNPHAKAYPRYGGRGIAVCDEWLEYKPFHDWAMAAGYRDDLCIERIDNDGNYESGNCCWISRIRQANNRRSNRFLECFGKSMTLADWGRETGLNAAMIWKRLARGWAPKDALCRPPVSNHATS